MQGYSESALLDLETSTPQVHRDSVIFAAQIMASMGWIPGFADFTQAFHSGDFGDPIDRELYAEQPAEGLTNAERGQLLRLRKTCYGLTDGPYAWFKHIVNFICNELGYRQSVVDPCLFFLDSPADSNGHSHVEEMTVESGRFYLQDHSESLSITRIAFQPKHEVDQFLQGYMQKTFSVFDPVKSGSGQLGLQYKTVDPK